MTIKKLNNQLDEVAMAEAGALIRIEVISGGYNQVIPNHPNANMVLKK